MEKINHEQSGEANLKEKQEDNLVRINITRHANRLSTGELREDGIRAAEGKGEALSDSEVVKGYGPGEKDDKTLRAFQTMDIISDSSKVESEQTGKKYETRKRKGLSYNISGPLMPRLKGYSKLINDAVKDDYPKFDPDSKDPKWGKIREKYQYIALQNLLAEDKELTHVFAMGAAHQYYDLVKLSSTYVRKRNKLAEDEKAKPIQGDVVLNEGTHGGFVESLLQKSLIRIQEDKTEKRGFDTWVDKNGRGQLEEKVGGILNPAESMESQYKVGEGIPDRIPVSFERDHFKGEECFLDVEKIKKLHDQFKEYSKVFKKWENEKTEENEKELLKLVDDLIKDFDN